MGTQQAMAQISPILRDLHSFSTISFPGTPDCQIVNLWHFPVVFLYLQALKHVTISS